MRIALVVARIASTLGQFPDVQPFAGRWAGDHDGRLVVRLDLRMNAGTLSGSIQLADIHRDTRGDVETVLSALSAASTLIGITSRSGALAFSRRDSNDIDHFEMRVLTIMRRNRVSFRRTAIAVSSPTTAFRYRDRSV